MPTWCGAGNSQFQSFVWSCFSRFTVMFSWVCSGRQRQVNLQNKCVTIFTQNFPRFFFAVSNFNKGLQCHRAKKAHVAWCQWPSIHNGPRKPTSRPRKLKGIQQLKPTTQMPINRETDEPKPETEIQKPKQWQKIKRTSTVRKLINKHEHREPAHVSSCVANSTSTYLPKSIVSESFREEEKK